MSKIGTKVIGTAIAGPGPSTLLYRTQLLASRPRFQVGTFGSTPLLCGPKRKQAQAVLDKQSVKARPKVTSDPIVTKADNRDLGVIWLRPPADYPIDDQLQSLHHAMDERNLDAVLDIWSHLIHLGCTNRLSEKEWEAISSFVAMTTSTKQGQGHGQRNLNYSGPHLGRMAIKQSHKFGLLRDMAIESASRGYTSGLFNFMMNLIIIGRPTDSVSSFTRCKERMREIQGKDIQGLYSWDRTERLNARLESKGNGLRDLILLNIAALTLLDKCDEHALFGMLDSHSNFRPQAKYDFEIFQRNFNQIKNGDSISLYNKFRQNVENLVLALQCYHPDALVSRINSLANASSSHKLDKLYERIMVASIGPNAFIRPRDLAELEVDYTAYRNIPLAPKVWWHFIRAFERRNEVDRIINVIDVDMPARNLQPDISFLSIAMVHMAIIASRISIPSHIRAKARKWVDEYWRRLTVAGWHTHDIAFSCRVRVLSILTRTESRFRDDLQNLYKAAKDGHLGPIGSKTRAAFVESFMAIRQLDKALNAIQDLPLPQGLSINFEQSPALLNEYEPSLAIFIRLLALGSWSPNEKMIACSKALLIIQKLKIPLRPITLGPLLAIQIQGGSPISSTVETILNYTLSEKRPNHGIRPWTIILYGLLTKLNTRHSPSFKELQGGLEILRRAAELQDGLYGYTRTRMVSMWMTFLRSCALSNSSSSSRNSSEGMNAIERQNFIDEALDLFPGGRENISVGMWFELIEYLLSRKDGNGLGEALRRWKEVLSLKSKTGDGGVHAIWWDKMLKLLLTQPQGRGREFAVDLLRDAWDNKRFRLEEGFWLRARAAGLIPHLGNGVEEQFSELDKKIRYGTAGRGETSKIVWRETLSRGDVGDDEVDYEQEEEQGIDIVEDEGVAEQVGLDEDALDEVDL